VFLLNDDIHIINKEWKFAAIYGSTFYMETSIRYIKEKRQE